MNKFLKKIKNNEEDLSVNITSMVDVIFILLIFFMVTTQFKKNSLPLNLPQTRDSQTTVQERSEKVLSVNESKIYFDGMEIELENLESELKNQFEKNPQMSLSFECEKTLEFEKVVQILEKIQNAGITNIGIINETLDN